MLLDWNHGGLADGLACYQRGHYFEAHEYWEAVWLTINEPEKSFLQALIQVTAAFHHFATGNRAGTVSLLTRALRWLEQCPDSFGGIELAALRAEISAWVNAIELNSSKELPPHPQIRLANARQ